MITPKVAAVAITKKGAQILAQLGPLLPEADLIVAERFLEYLLGVPNRVSTYQGPVGAQMGPLFKTYDQLIFCVSLGAVVRLAAPHLKTKETDPGVLVIDDACQFVVAVLSGHLGGANAFTIKVAKLLGAQPVITTASDAGGTLAVDILGREQGFKVEADKKTLIRLAAQVVNEEPVALVQESGTRDWWKGPIPENIKSFDWLEDADPNRFSGVLCITNRALPLDLSKKWQDRLVLYRPPEPL
ncbi:MAG: cobalamin biosynthesis protein CbiG [Candidatus Lambdaproteobacteria bacterium RIFOXYD2_FULL_50_16]|uniref:Cobalamin biosynthesis protein CbiG n=1 Tax=Candidatus Lambdaproteobacteria bacterium RIFOXYD2_FULL_50_16 TaxID=1817772 RepID=A0A1F6G8V6_9PROT|nr:MAG: cobalamin biosynthesis protein CbiG [Candidatus Lambdaproteobacteria bacterium RIFOXYD2_FULL_50_16]